MKKKRGGSGYGRPETEAETGEEGRPTDRSTVTRPRLMSQRSACRYLGGISLEMLRGLRNRGELTTVRLGSRILVKVEELDLLIEAQSFIEEVGQVQKPKGVASGVQD